jgi:hypothetical protein
MQIERWVEQLVEMRAQNSFHLAEEEGWTGIWGCSPLA